MIWPVYCEKCLVRRLSSLQGLHSFCTLWGPIFFLHLPLLVHRNWLTRLIRSILSGIRNTETKIDTNRPTANKHCKWQQKKFMIEWRQRQQPRASKWLNWRMSWLMNELVIGCSIPVLAVSRGLSLFLVLDLFQLGVSMKTHSTPFKHTIVFTKHGYCLSEELLEKDKPWVKGNESSDLWRKNVVALFCSR